MGTLPQATSLEDFFAHSPDMLFLADPDAGLLGASDALVQALGPEARAGASLVDLAHPDDREVLKAAFGRLKDDARGTAAEVECRLRLADGAHGTFLWKARRSPKDGSVFGSLTRVTADEAEKNRGLSALKAITESLDLVVWSIDRDGKFTQHTGRGLAAAHLTEGQFLGQNIFEIYAYQTEGLTQIRRALAGERTHDFSSSHGMYWENWHVPLVDGAGQIQGVTGLTLNITAAKRAEQELLARLDLIERQQEAIQALSIPIIQVWDSVLTVPLVGMVDSMRAAELMEKLLGEVVRTRARFAVLDLTGVDAMDTSTASHMLRLVAALRLLGAEGILTGIRPSIAHTMVGLGLDMGSVKTLANLRAGLRFCMDQMESPDEEEPGPRAA